MAASAPSSFLPAAAQGLLSVSLRDGLRILAMIDHTLFVFVDRVLLRAAMANMALRGFRFAGLNQFLWASSLSGARAHHCRSCND